MKRRLINFSDLPLIKSSIEEACPNVRIEGSSHGTPVSLFLIDEIGQRIEIHFFDAHEYGIYIEERVEDGSR